jgi:hypothetical protein
MEKVKMKTKSNTLIKALRILSEDVQSDDGVANACIAEAANRIEELEAKVSELNQKLCKEIFRLRGS